MKTKYFHIGLFIWMAMATLSCSNKKDNNASSVQQIQNRGEGKNNWWDSLPRPAWSQFEKIDQDQDWFEVYLVQPGIYAIYEPGQFDEVISYLITGSEKALLFDTGLGIGDIKKVVEKLTDLEIFVLNSHSHYDHIGGNHQFDNIFAMATEYTRVNALGTTHDEVKTFVSGGWIWKPTPDSFSVDQYRIKPFKITKETNGGEKIDLGDRVLEIIFTPGHAPDAICLIDRENRLLFTGDTFYPAPLYTHLEGSDFATYAESASYLASIKKQVDKLLPGHNEPLLDSHYLIQMAAAFSTIQKGKGTFVKSDGNREYQFDGFSIIVKGEK